MKQKVKTTQDDKEFERFDNILSQVIRVPKDEINKRENEEKQKKEVKKKGLKT